MQPRNPTPAEGFPTNPFRPPVRLQGLSDAQLREVLPGTGIDQKAAALNALSSSHQIQILLNPLDNTPVYKAVSLDDSAKWVVLAGGRKGRGECMRGRVRGERLPLLPPLPCMDLCAVQGPSSLHAHAFLSGRPCL